MTERVKILEGERVALALSEKEDSLLRYRHMNNLEVQQFLSVGGCLLYKEAEQDYYDHIIKNPNMRVFAICIEGEKNIGNISLEINRKNRNAELGIAIFDKNYWSQGYGTESIQLLFKYAFEILGLHKVYLNVIANNARAAKAYEKVGFKEIGRRKEHWYFWGKYHDMIEMEIMSNEYSSH